MKKKECLRKEIRRKNSKLRKNQKNQRKKINPEKKDIKKKNKNFKDLDLRKNYLKYSITIGKRKIVKKNKKNGKNYKVN